MELPNTMRKDGARILMTTEGTYPFSGGGVSTWCHTLIKEMPNFRFSIYSVMMNPYLKQRYELPANVDKLIKVPLWGIEEPTEFSKDVPFSRIYRAKKNTSPKIVEEKFVPYLRVFLREIKAGTNSALIGNVLYSMYNYFQEYDYNETFRDESVWDTFNEEIQNLFNESNGNAEKPNRAPDIYEITECLRWLYRFFMTLNIELDNYDITHSAAAAFCGIPCVISKIRDGTPYLLTEHGIYAREQYIAISRMGYTYFSKQFLIHLITSIARMNYFYANQISPVCAYNIRWERQMGADTSRIRVIYNGVDPELFAPSVELRDSPNPVISTIALIYPLKDIITLIKAAHHVHEKVPNAEFEIYGSVSDEDYYKDCLKLRSNLGLDETVHFKGHTSNPAKAINKSDVVVLSSLSEAFPYAVVETMMCGKPMVATDVGGVKEALKETGLVVRPRDPQSLGGAILKLLDNEDMRRKMGADARDRAVSEFTIKNFVRQYQESYERLYLYGD